MVNAHQQSPFSRMSGGKATDVAMVQALVGIETQLKRLADVEEEKMANERIAMQNAAEGLKYDGGGDLKTITAHVRTDLDGKAHACLCPHGVNH